MATSTVIKSDTTTITGTLKSNTLDPIAVDSIQTIGSILTTGSLTLGGALTTGDITIGNSAQTDTTITQNATKIISNITVLGGSIIQNVIGNADSVSSLSTTFNRKFLVNTVTNPVYKISLTAPTLQTFVCQYMELTVSGSAAGVGGFAYKMSFIVTNDEQPVGVTNLQVINPTILTSYVCLSLSAALPVSVTFTKTIPYELIVNILTPCVLSQNYVSTLVAYPTLFYTNTGINNNDWKIEAL
jgi:hypothetical protein